MEILFVASEVRGIHQTGGLGDVVRDLAVELSRQQFNTKVAIPMYRHLDKDENKHKLIAQTNVKFGNESKSVSVFEVEIENTGIKCCLFHEESLISSDQRNDVFRFGVMSQAIANLEVEGKSGFDIYHLHDWHTGLIPVLFKTLEINRKTVFTIHNVLFQGNIDPIVLDNLGIGRNLENIAWDIADGDLNMLMQGIINADFVTTVSPSYKSEILAGINSGGMEKVLIEKGDNFAGILNGIDLSTWNPSTDRNLEAKFNISNWQEGKKSARQKLSAMLKDPLTENELLIGYIGRADGRQKGIQLILESLEDLIDEKSKFVLLSEGDGWLEDQIRDKANSNTKFDAFVKFDDPLAHLIYAASDMVLIPSAYEPCGLVQMMAMKYGTIPLARATGGLKDTIIEGKNGFLFDEYSGKALVEKFNYVKSIYDDKQRWNEIVNEAMMTDWGWEKPAIEYSNIYLKVMEKS